jgi:hypothetical protein
MRLMMLCCVCCPQVPAVVGLSVLELCMLVAAQRLEDAGSSVFNFQVRLAEWECVQEVPGRSHLSDLFCCLWCTVKCGVDKQCLPLLLLLTAAVGAALVTHLFLHQTDAAG